MGRVERKMTPDNISFELSLLELASGEKEAHI